MINQISGGALEVDTNSSDIMKSVITVAKWQRHHEV